MKQENYELEDSLDYITRSCFQEKEEKEKSKV
jgi:hypothetical protein